MGPSACLPTFLRSRYRPPATARYGKLITIERRITKTSYPFKIIGANGKTAPLSGKSVKDDVDAILDNFSINAGNPLTVITQDMSRQFLSGEAGRQVRGAEHS